MVNYVFSLVALLPDKRFYTAVVHEKGDSYPVRQRLLPRTGAILKGAKMYPVTVSSRESRKIE